MKDLMYDINARDLVMKNGDFVYTDNPSVQNGMLLLLSRANNIRNLIMGIGINQLRGGTVANVSYEMSRWKSQVQQDGGQASVSVNADSTGNTEIGWDLNYL